MDIIKTFEKFNNFEIEIIRDWDFEVFCKRTVVKDFMTPLTKEQQIEIDNYLNNNIVSDDLLKMYCHWQMEVIGDMKNKIIFSYNNRLVKCDYNDGNIKIMFIKN